MLDYTCNGIQKHNMLISHLTYKHYVMNILYEDYDGGDIMLVITTNLKDFDDDREYIIQVKNVFQHKILEYFKYEYTRYRLKIPEYIKYCIFDKIRNI